MIAAQTSTLVGSFGERHRYPEERNFPSQSLARSRHVIDLERRIARHYATMPGADVQAARNKAIARRAQMVRDVYDLERQIADPTNMENVLELKRLVRVLQAGIATFDEYHRQKTEFIPRIVQIAALFLFLALLSGCTTIAAPRESADANAQSAIINSQSSIPPVPEPPEFTAWRQTNQFNQTQSGPPELPPVKVSSDAREHWLNWHATNQLNTKN